MQPIPITVFSDVTLEATFLQNGYITMELCDRRAAAELKRIWSRFSARHPQTWLSNTLMISDLALRREVHREVSAVLKPVLAQVIHAKLCVCLFITKLGRGLGRAVPLHQDWTYVDEVQYRSLAVWCPLTDVAEANGCLTVVPHSNRLARYARGPEVRSPFDPILPLLAGYQRSVPLAAGQIILYDQALFHGSTDNTSESSRVAVGAVAIPEASRLYFVVGGECSDSCQSVTFCEVPNTFYQDHIFGSSPSHVVNSYQTELKAIAMSERTVRDILCGH